MSKPFPNLAHFYWGGKNISLLRCLTIISFMKYNPDWFVKLHVSSHSETHPEFRANNFHFYDQIDYEGEDYFNLIDKKIQIINHNFEHEHNLNQNISEAHKSDILGWKILSSEGGIWMDMDILFFKSLEESDLNFESKDTFICFDHRHPIDYSPLVNAITPIGFLASKGENELFKKIYKKSLLTYDAKYYQSAGSEVLSSEVFNIKDCKNKFPNLKIQSIDPDLIYKYNYMRLNKIFSEDVFDNLQQSNAIGVHWYGGSEIAKNFNNILSLQNLNDLETTTITRIIKKVIC